MKKSLFLFAIFLFISMNSKAQDTIIKINGDTIFAKISEITPTEIKYKKFNFQDGPFYVENKSEIKQITYSNGLKEVFSVKEVKASVPETNANNDYYNPNTTQELTHKRIEPFGVRYIYEGRKIGEREMQRILMNTQDKQIVGLVQSAKDANKMQYIGFAAIPLGIGSLVAFANSFTYSNSGNYVGQNSGLVTASVFLAAATVACPIISIVSKSKRKRCNREAVKLYNEKY